MRAHSVEERDACWGVHGVHAAGPEQLPDAGELQEALAILEESRTASRESSPVKAPAEPASEGQ